MYHSRVPPPTPEPGNHPEEDPHAVLLVIAWLVIGTVIFWLAMGALFLHYLDK